MPLILGTNSIKDTGYNVANSLRFNSGSSDRLTRSFSAGSSSLWTWSGWIKRSKLGSRQSIFTAYSSSSNVTRMEFTANDELKFNDENGGNTNGRIVSSAKYRDPSAWMHIVFHWDSSDSTSADRLRMYVNNVRVTDFSDTGNAPSTTSRLNTAMTHELGSENNGTFFEGYMCEVVFINGANLDPDQFGEYDEDSPTIWKPKDVSGLSFGTTGFYLDYEDSSSLGNDVSGNNNDWTVSNLTSIDQSTDTCTNNYSTIGTLFTALNAPTYSEGNLQSYSTASGNYPIPSGIGVANGKWYMELKYAATTSNDNTGVGITHDPASANQANTDQGGYSINYYASSGYIDLYGSSGGTFSTYTVGDIIGIYMDIDNKKLYFAKNGTIQNSGTGLNITTSTTGFYYFQVNDFTSSSNYWTWQWNFGAGCPFTISSGNTDPNGYGNFEYSPNDGGSASFDSSAKDFYALNTKNLAEFG
jgi:hypothetical protein